MTERQGWGVVLKQRLITLWGGQFMHHTGCWKNEWRKTEKERGGGWGGAKSSKRLSTTLAGYAA